jgi:Tfp pilus assembly protein PilO
MKNSTALILVLVSVGLFYTFIGPQYTKAKDLMTQSAEFKNVLENVSSITDKKNDLLVKYQAMPQSDILRVNKILPSNVDTVQLATDFDSIASKYGISIKNIKTAENKIDNTATIMQDATEKPYNAVKVSFAFTSTYDNFRKFMQDIEKSLRIIDIKSLSFNSTDAGLNEYEVSIQTYWLK